MDDVSIFGIDLYTDYSDDIRREIGKVPKYKINKEAYDTLATAKSQAYGKDRDIQTAQENVDRDVATSLGQAKDITSSTTALLSALSNIESQGMSTKRNLAADEASLRRGKMQDLYSANQSMIDEKDKAFMQNEMAPWLYNYQYLLQQQRREDAKATEMLGMWGDSSSSFMGMMGGMMGG
jgi:hypothetical protein